MEIESKLDEDRVEIIKKDPDVGDMVAYNRHGMENNTRRTWNRYRNL